MRVPNTSPRSSGKGYLCGQRSSEDLIMPADLIDRCQKKIRKQDKEKREERGETLVISYITHWEMTVIMCI